MYFRGTRKINQSHNFHHVRLAEREHTTRNTCPLPLLQHQLGFVELLIEVHETGSMLSKLLTIRTASSHIVAIGA